VEEVTTPPPDAVELIRHVSTNEVIESSDWEPQLRRDAFANHLTSEAVDIASSLSAGTGANRTSIPSGQSLNLPKDTKAILYVRPSSVLLSPDL
jgi:hypothetical protein